MLPWIAIRNVNASYIYQKGIKAAFIIEITILLKMLGMDKKKNWGFLRAYDR